MDSNAWLAPPPIGNQNEAAAQLCGAGFDSSYASKAGCDRIDANNQSCCESCRSTRLWSGDNFHRIHNYERNDAHARFTAQRSDPRTVQTNRRLVGCPRYLILSRFRVGRQSDAILSRRGRWRQRARFRVWRKLDYYLNFDGAKAG